MLRVALTGDVGAGKSTLLREWSTLGASVINTDSIAKEQWSRAEVISAAAARWGDSIITDGEPDYARIAGFAFSDGEEFNFVNSLIHPFTIAEVDRRLASLRGWVVVEVPLLFESGMHHGFDCVVYVTASDSLRVARNTVRGWSGDEIERRERFLMPREDKERLSDIVLNNDGDRDLWLKRAGEWGSLFRRMSSVCILSTTCATEGEAVKIAELLVKSRLAACVNISSCHSIYSWNDELCREDEWKLECKSAAYVLRQAVECIRANHSYSLPAITVTELLHSDFATLKWIVESLSAPAPLI